MACMTAVCLCASSAHGSVAELVAFYTFEEGAGDVLHDKSGHDNHGRIDGATWIKGKFGHALEFDGKNDSVIVPPSESLRMGLDGFTIEAWFRTAHARNNNRLVTAGYMYWELWTNRGALAASVADVKKQNQNHFRCVINSPFVVDDGLWHHGAAVFDRNGTLRLYLDGKECGAANLRPLRRVDLPAQQVLIGAHGVGGHRAFGGAIAEVAIHKGMLTQAQIKTRYDRGVLRFLY